LTHTVYIGIDGRKCLVVWTLYTVQWTLLGVRTFVLPCFYLLYDVRLSHDFIKVQ